MIFWHNEKQSMSSYMKLSYDWPQITDNIEHVGKMLIFWLQQSHIPFKQHYKIWKPGNKLLFLFIIQWNLDLTNVYITKSFPQVVTNDLFFFNCNFLGYGSKNPDIMKLRQSKHTCIKLICQTLGPSTVHHKINFAFFNFCCITRQILEHLY